MEDQRISSSSDSPSEDGSLVSHFDLNEDGDEREPMTRVRAWNLYMSHFLSTWNMRVYEFAAIIFTASAYPDTLLAASIRGIVRTLASMCFSSAVGKWIDRSPNRLSTLTTTIVVNRFSVILASVLWLFIVDIKESSNDDGYLRSPTIKGVISVAILMLGVLETLSATGNTISMERDWIVVAASSIGNPYDLTALNSTMRRIDLMCKLIAPILISAVISFFNTKTGVLTVAGMSFCSVGLEWYCAQSVWTNNPKLRTSKRLVPPAIVPVKRRFSILSYVYQLLGTFSADLQLYFSSIVCTPSLALSLLHLSALAYSASLITFLLSVGVTLNTITVARAIGSIVEVSSTVLTPIGVNRLSKAKTHGSFYEQTISNDTADLLEVHANDKGSEIGLFRLGLWGLSWQFINLVPVLFALWSMSSGNNGIMTSVTLFFFLSSSRLGLWVYDLTTQQLTQTMTNPAERSSFAGVENSFVSMFELLQNVAIIILSSPNQFKWIAIMSLFAVAVSTTMYASWVWRMRGHLVHWDTILKSCECIKMRISS